MNRPVAWRLTLFLVWSLAAGWFVRYEAFPEYFQGLQRGYSGMLSDDLLVMDSWMRIRYQGNDLGYTHTSVQVDDTNRTERYQIETTVQLNMKVMGSSMKMDILMTSYLDDRRTLSRFAFDAKSPVQNVKMEGRRGSPGQFEVNIQAGGISPARKSIAVPEDTIIHTPMAEITMRRLKPGQVLHVTTLDPLTFQRTSMTVRAVRQERIRVRNRPVPTTLISLRHGTYESFLWMDADGGVLRHETPFGVTLDRCTPEEAVQAFAVAGTRDIGQQVLQSLVGGGGKLP